MYEDAWLDAAYEDRYDRGFEYGDDDRFYDGYDEDEDEETCETLGEIACGTEQCVCDFEPSDEDIDQANDGSDW